MVEPQEDVGENGRLQNGSCPHQGSEPAGTEEQTGRKYTSGYSNLPSERWSFKSPTKISSMVHSNWKYTRKGILGHRVQHS